MVSYFWHTTEILRLCSGHLYSVVDRVKCLDYWQCKKTSQNLLDNTVLSRRIFFVQVFIYRVILDEEYNLLCQYSSLDYLSVFYRLNCGLYLISLFELTYCAVVAAMTTDPMVYGDGALQIVRAVFEVFFYVTTIITLAIEINQFRK